MWSGVTLLLLSLGLLGLGCGAEPVKNMSKVAMQAHQLQLEQDAQKLLATLQNGTNRTIENENDMLQRIMNLVITDASIVRLGNNQENTSEGCVWPSCASYCVPCAKTNKYWTCLSSATQCQQNSECVMGACFAEPGFCYADAYPQVARCYMGAKPKRVKFWNTFILRLGAAPPVPLPSGSFEEWFAWARSCLIVPATIFIFSIYVAYKLCWVIEFSSGDQCTWLPQTRYGIICFSVWCLLFFFMFQVVRFLVVRSDIMTLEVRLSELQKSVRHFQDCTNQLVEAEYAYNQSLAFAPDSCGKHNPMATHLVQLLVGALQGEFKQVALILEIVRETLDTMVVLLAKGKSRLDYLSWVLIYYPIFPAGIMLVGMLILLGIAFYAWNRPETLSNPYFKGAMNMLSPCIVIFILFCGLCAALCFYLSMLITGYCYNIDANLQVASTRVDFGQEVREKMDVSPILQHTAAYYLQGINVNPLATLLQNFEAALYTVKRFYEMFEWLVDAGAASCPGLHHLSPAPLLASLLETTSGGYDFISAENMYPYYEAIVHKTVCRNFPRNGMGLVFICIVVGFFFCPAIAITISNHLKYTRFELTHGRSASSAEQDDKFGALGVHIQSRLSELSVPEQALLLGSLHEEVQKNMLALQPQEEVSETESESEQKMC